MAITSEFLSAGPLHLLYDQGSIRRISYGDHELLRMIYFAVRDENWITLESRLSDVVVDHNSNPFTVRYTCANLKDGHDVFVWRCRIEGSSNGSITFAIDGEVLQPFKRNRAGFCILHPVKPVAGTAATIIHPDRTTSQINFPVYVSPENPFKNIRELRWRSAGLDLALTMAGDIFETEDQRNWCDASYKTFCTPQHLPFPVLLKRGDVVNQTVTFQVLSPTGHHVQQSRSVGLKKNDHHLRLPAIGVGASTELDTLNAGATERLKVLNLDHYRLDVRPGHPGWVAAFSRQCEIAFDLDLPLYVALHLTENFIDELEAFVMLSLQNRIRLKSVLVLSEQKPVTDQRIIDHISEKIQTMLPRVAWGAGTDLNFTELNKYHFATSSFHFVAYSAHPQEHAFDDLTLIENMEGLMWTACSARQLYPNCRIHLSPVTLRRRSNPAATEPSKRVLPEDAKADPRQVTEFTALWMFGSLRSLAEAGVESVTCFQTAGRQGFVSSEGLPYPVHDLLRQLLPFRDNEMIGLESSHPLKVDAMLFRQGAARALWIANYTNDPQRVTFEDLEISVSPMEIKSLRLGSA